MEQLFKHKHHYVGQSLIEAVVAVGIVLLLVTGLVAATTSTLRFGQMSKYRTQALQYAREALEIVRIVKDTNWNDIPTSGTYCLAKNQQDLGSPAAGDCPFDIDSIYSRTLVFGSDATCSIALSCRKVTVTVSWKEATVQSVALTSFITNWRTRQ